MAELHVEPKKSSPLLWIIVVILVLLGLFFLYRNFNSDKKDNMMENKADSVATTSDNTTSNVAAAMNPANWDGIDYNAPKASYEEITNKDIDVRNSDKYALYGVGQDILFDKDKSTIRSGADENLKQIAESISKRYSDKPVRLYGFTDNTGSKDYNKELSAARAEAVKSWLTSKGNINDSRLSIEPMGESEPTSTNATAEGRQENRRVEIVVNRS